jgi:hypothetical protein
MENDFLPLDLDEMSHLTGNIYKSVSLIGLRSNQHTTAMKEELGRKLAEFAPAHDNLDEITENREQIEISKQYERLPKPTRVAVEEFMKQGR